MKNISSEHYFPLHALEAYKDNGNKIPIIFINGTTW
jgi:hypothetical protein